MRQPATKRERWHWFFCQGSFATRRVPFLTTLSLPVALSLAAGGSGGPTVTATNASATEVEAKVAVATGNGDMISPGRWEGVMTMHQMKLPNMDKLPPAARAQRDSRLAAGNARVSCVTGEEFEAKRVGACRGTPDEQ